VGDPNTIPLGVGSAHVHSACAAHSRAGAVRVRSVRPALTEPASASATHARAVTAPRHASRCKWRWLIPTTVRLPAGHGEGEDSSPERFIDGEGEETGSAVAFFR
jgi:hypothetical protein